MHLTAHTPKLPALPQLKSSCGLTQKILNEDCPEFAEIRRILSTKESKNANHQACCDLLEAAKNKADAASLVFYADNTRKNFEALIAANAENDQAQSAFNRIMQFSSGSINDWMKGDDVREATLAALRVIQKRLAAKISKLNDEEAKRLIEAGLDPTGEHPAISRLKESLSSVAGSIIHLQDGGRFNWNEYTNLFRS